MLCGMGFRPFRWDIRRREQLGALIAGAEAESYPAFMHDLRICAARVIAMCDDADLVFVGRSPESIFDYLSGMFAGTTWFERLSLLNLSIADVDASDVRIGAGPDVHVLRKHLAELGLAPSEIATRPRPVTFVDLVWRGRTFGALSTALAEWTREENFDANAVTRQVRFLGITWRTKTSPNTWRWHQHAGWLSSFSRSAVKNVSIPGRMWDYLGNQQAKVARTQPRPRWRDTEWRFAPPRDSPHLESLRLALRIFDTARSRQERSEFARELARQPALSKPWLRSLLGELRRTSNVR